MSTTKKQEVTLYVSAEKWCSNRFEIEINTYDPSRHADNNKNRIVIPLSQVTVEIEVPDISEKQLQAEEIKQLQASIDKEKADSYVRIKAIEERIQSLMAIEHSSN